MWRWSDRGGFLDRTQRLEEILMEVDRTLAILSLSQLVTFSLQVVKEMDLEMVFVLDLLQLDRLILQERTQS